MYVMAIRPCDKTGKSSRKSACILPGALFCLIIGRQPATEMEQRSCGIEVGHGG